MRIKNTSYILARMINISDENGITLRDTVYSLGLNELSELRYIYNAFKMRAISKTQ